MWWGWAGEGGRESSGEDALLASSQLLSDQLASVPDPRVQRFAPKLMRSLERAIAFCQATISYGRAQEAELPNLEVTQRPHRAQDVMAMVCWLSTTPGEL